MANTFGPIQFAEYILKLFTIRAEIKDEFVTLWYRRRSESNPIQSQCTTRLHELVIRKEGRNFAAFEGDLVLRIDRPLELPTQNRLPAPLPMHRYSMTDFENVSALFPPLIPRR